MALHSIVIPIFNEEETLPELHRRLSSEILEPLKKRGDTHELILIDDGSRDNSFALLKDLQKKDPQNISVIRFSRNFGHQMAITAGLDVARGDTVTIIDADLQDPPAVILQLIDKWQEGYDVVYAVRAKRLEESFFKKITANLFYRTLRASTNLEIPRDVGDFRLMSQRAVAAFRQMREQHRFVRGMAKWIGFRDSFVTYVRAGRFAGETKYPLKKMLRLAWDGFTGFSLLPLRLATLLGLISIGFGVLAIVWDLVNRFVTNLGSLSLAVILILVLGGLQLFSIGILGEYLGRTFEQVKNRPLYLVQEILGPAASIQE